MKITIKADHWIWWNYTFESRFGITVNRAWTRSQWMNSDGLCLGLNPEQAECFPVEKIFVFEVKNKFGDQELISSYYLEGHPANTYAEMIDNDY